MASVTAIGPGGGEALWMFGCLTTIRAEHENVGAVVEHWCPKAMATPIHVQPEDYEAFYVLEGEVARAHARLLGSAHRNSPGFDVRRPAS